MRTLRIPGMASEWLEGSGTICQPGLTQPDHISEFYLSAPIERHGPRAYSRLLPLDGTNGSISTVAWLRRMIDFYPWEDSNDTPNQKKAMRKLAWRLDLI